MLTIGYDRNPLLLEISKHQLSLGMEMSVSETNQASLQQLIPDQKQLTLKLHYRDLIYQNELNLLVLKYQTLFLQFL
ncbi:CLUMA_CG018022, isoform A [Clunio marinus]|uniref:CLUMA_CG018022, isoform A n=1 Tax=Clunio marinus TaxID=568069 RepID=A0A1J1J1G9_9DIPT|nr:CLUMA_CG018022, isoform A [Clunio marinus]